MPAYIYIYVLLLLLLLLCFVSDEKKGTKLVTRFFHFGPLPVKISGYATGMIGRNSIAKNKKFFLKTMRLKIPYRYREIVKNS